ncbi:MAG: hypothetical protein JRH08_12135 [Deltaproteobacteria bacterium]|nr:hypothetical protein [Deltaproteobacteria bacterium]MBW2026477.1 hypothetical protein [Deltaproteobacteria bacterium]MBW2126420.1 hypothetical protein [Deltaproteobacteria bacterium]
MCEKNPDCFNSKTLVLDTNFLDQVNRTIRAELGSKTLGKPFEEQRPIFITRAQKIVENMGRCGGGQVFTSDKVYDDEIDISKLNSALRTADPDFFDNLCMDLWFIHTLSDIYQNGISIEEMTEREVEVFQGILSEDVGYADASLVLLALKLSQDQEVVVITDDLELQKAIKDLIKRDRISFEDRSLTTRNIHCIGSLLFLRSLHLCCELSNDRWRSAIWSFAEHQINRYDNGEISLGTYQEHRQYADQCIAQMLADCEAKKQREERNEDYKLFGVTDE